MATPADPVAIPKVAVVLAAGKGIRMRSALPKVLHQVAGRPLVEWVLEAIRAVGCQRILVVVGSGAEEVQRGVAGDDVTWVCHANSPSLPRFISKSVT